MREAADRDARSVALTQGLAALRPVRIVDLGTGTGANLRYLAPRLGGSQHWLLVDRDAGLLGRLPGCLPGVEWDAGGRELLWSGPGFRCRLDLRQANLAGGLAELLRPSPDLVTASALLDLVSASWLTDLLDRAAACGCSLLFALNYRGRVRWSPTHALDRRVLGLVNRHQCSDKGLGPALGPAAARLLPRWLASRGYQYRTAPSDWCLAETHGRLQTALLEDWHNVALAMDPSAVDQLRAWLSWRRARLAEGRSRLQVAHSDVLAWCPLRQSQSNMTSGPIRKD